MKLARIQQLPPAIANQIAAGEVIERPASVVKELLENASDAGADTIHIDINYGGLNQIKISDNGQGIMAEDLILAVTAHATSKIQKLDDLYAIVSLGFRGEALASIAAVSRLSISSKHVSQAHAMQLEMKDTGPQLIPTARAQGTTIVVDDLFFNAPVRKKFLKSPRVEYQAIETVVKRFALSMPHVALKLTHDDKLLLSLDAATCEKTRIARIRKLLGKTFIEHAISIESEQANMRLQGFISNLTFQRSQQDKQWLYINQRMVKDKLLQHAVRQAYDGLLYPGRFPSCLLYLTLPSAEVDVNVHPTKHEVRFQQPRLIHDFMVSQLSKALDQTNNVKLVARNHSNTPSFQAPLQALPTPSKSGWFILNAHFVIIVLNNEPYMVDIKAMQHHRLWSELHEATLPLANRPLLVPVSLVVDKQACAALASRFALLQQLGIEVGWISDTTIAIRTLPVSLAEVNLQQFIAAVAQCRADITSILKLLIEHQTIDAYQLDEAAQATYIDYFITEWQPAMGIKRWGVHLDSRKCRDVMA